jgi:hypothetical protein
VGVLVEAHRAVAGMGVIEVLAMAASVMAGVVMAVEARAARVGTCSALRNHYSQSHTRTVPPPHASLKASLRRRPGKCCCTIECMHLSTTRAAVERMVVALAAAKEVAREGTCRGGHSRCNQCPGDIALERCEGW